MSIYQYHGHWMFPWVYIDGDNVICNFRLFFEFSTPQKFKKQKTF